MLIANHPVVQEALDHVAILTKIAEHPNCDPFEAKMHRKSIELLLQQACFIDCEVKEA